MTRRRLGRGRLVLASHNAGKLREVAALLAPHGLQVVSAKELGLPEPEESADTFLGNAGIKALAAARWRRNSSSVPCRARRSRSSSCASEKGAPSAVPCTSTSPPPPVSTKFASACALLSSS